jgi:hypothetical protein
MSTETVKTESNLKALQDNVNELATRFDKLREDVISKLNECSDCIKAAKQLCHVSEVGDGFAFSSERFAPLLVPNVNHCVPDAGRRVLSDGIFSL